MRIFLALASMLMVADAPAIDLVAQARAGRVDMNAILTARFEPSDGRFAALKNWAENPSDAELAQLRRGNPCGITDARAPTRAALIIAEGSTDRTLAAKRWAEVEQVFANGATLERNSLAEAPNVAKTRRTALGKALVFRVARDQAWRSVFNSEHDAVTLDAIGYRIGPPICHIDADNHAWLESLVEKGKWPTRSSDGAAAAHDAWLLAQHADNYPDFQERVLALMAPLIKNGEASGKDYAYLFDRVALARKRPQRYATQFEIDDKGCQRPQPTEDFAHINVRRAEAHLEPIEEYAKRLRDAYKQPVCLPPPFGSN